MIKVRVFNANYSSEGMIGPWRHWNPDLSTVYKNMEIVCDDSYTHAVIIDNARPKLKPISKRNIVGYEAEPFPISGIQGSINYIVNSCDTFYCYDREGLPNLPPVFKNGIGMLPPMGFYDGNFQTKKPKLMSYIMSSKGFLEGHKLRHAILEEILKTDMQIDIFGRGLVIKDHRMKGELVDKKNGLKPYKFTICIENLQYHSYFSEKFTDPLLCNSIPIYWGSPRMDEMFRSDSFIGLPKSIDGIMETITDIYHNPYKYEKDCSLGVEDLKYKTNWLEHMWRHFNET
jgi:hypothetical protein